MFSSGRIRGDYSKPIELLLSAMPVDNRRSDNTFLEHIRPLPAAGETVLGADLSSKNAL
jgi:hypothetical protein